MAFVPLYLLLICIPLGVAGQNIGIGLVGAILLGRLAWRIKTEGMPRLPSMFLPPFLIAVAYLAVHLISAGLNPTLDFSAKFLGGYLTWVLLAPLAVITLPRIPDDHWRRLGLWMAMVALLMGVMALSQYLWGWRIQGTEFVRTEYRARGLYSHPLTLAYVSLVIFSVAVAAWTRDMRRKSAWVWLLGAAAAIFGSLSKTVLAVAFGLAAVCVLIKLQGKKRLAAVVLITLGVVATAVTENPVSRRFSHISRGVDVAGDRVDDRLVFWDIAWSMIQERPVLGHGPNLSTEYRIPYYDAAGYVDFAKPYEAHNVFLQVLVSGGVVGLGLFIAWWGWHLYAAWRARPHWSAYAGIAAILTFAAASLTQNSFQDSEVRFTIAVAAAFFWLWLRGQSPDCPHGEQSGD